MRSIAGDQMDLMTWLEEYIFKAEAVAVTPEFCQIGTQLAMLEMIRTGTTTFVDMYYFENEIATATAAAGMRAILGQAVIDFPVSDAPTPQDALNLTEIVFQNWVDHPLITPAVAPHAPHTVATLSLIHI